MVQYINTEEKRMKGTRMVKRIYIEKKKGFTAEAINLMNDLKSVIDLPGLTGVRIVNRYDIDGIDDETYSRAKYIVLSDKATELTYDDELPEDLSPTFFAFEYLPGQYDQRADSAAQCIKALNPFADVIVKYARVIALDGNLSDGDISAVKKYCINPVDSKESAGGKPESLQTAYECADKVKILDGFINLPADGLLELKKQSGFAMSDGDICFIQKYFKDEEKRDPTITEIRALDAYWSDHCRHTTFMTKLNDIKFETGTEAIKEAFGEYLDIRKEIYGRKEKDVCLMDVACIGAKYLKKRGLLKDVDESDEVNACSIKIKAEIDGKEEDWLVMFKNETHNHPTEIEPFGGASTCLGGAIRDPLSGRAHVYQAMRVTGAGDPRKSVKGTLPGKLPQRKITLDAVAGYSSYGNQIGLTSGQVTEIYDEGYIAKRMELGALIAAAPACHVVRERPVPGDVIILVGGRTGRDGCGGATGSSKGHTEESMQKSGAEVQKGDPALERNIVRLFRRKEAANLIKKCNDFGAGGVSVAIGELADSIDVDLDLIPVKYEGLDGTELSISESQERMAVVVSESKRDAFIAFALEENLEATAVAKVTDTGRFRIFWRGEAIFDISRKFLDTNGTIQEAEVTVKAFEPVFGDDAEKDFIETLKDLNCCSQKGLIERFDSAIGAATLLAPLGGRYQLTPAPGMAAKLPVLKGETNTATLMAYGYNPKISKASPFHGAMYAVLESITKIAAMGGDISNIRLTFQEYFEKLDSPESWGKPFAALLGALKVQKALSIPSIGGKDSMSGTFMDISVPPALVSFSVCVGKADRIISPELKRPGSKLVLVSVDYDNDGVPDFTMYKEAMKRISILAEKKKILAANTVGQGGIFVSLVKMAAGNRIGFNVKGIEDEKLKKPDSTAVILEIPENEDAGKLFAGIKYSDIGKTTEDGKLVIDGMLSLGIEGAIEKWTAPLKGVFPVSAMKPEQEENSKNVETFSYKERYVNIPKTKAVKPRVLVPVFPGTNCEVDLMRAFEKAGADVDIHLMRNLNMEMLIESADGLAEKIRKCQIIAMPGGGGMGNEPGGASKFMTAALLNGKVKEAVTDLIENRDGLMIGIGSGFQALLRSGLLPCGKIFDIDDKSPTLTVNVAGNHVSRIVRTRVSSVKSPWLSGVSVGDIHAAHFSLSEGRFVISEKQIAEFAGNGQIAAQYVDFNGNATMDPEFNPCGSFAAIEALTSPDGRIIGKATHPERAGNNLYINVPGDYDQKIFEAGIKYFNY